MAEKIAEYFGQLKFIVDDKGLKEFVKQLEMAAKSMKAVTMASGTHGMRAIAEGMKRIGAEAKQAASQVEQAVGKMDRASSKSARTQKTLVGLKATDIKSRGALGDFQNRAQLIAMRDYAARMNSARDARDNLRAQRRAETASREDERRFQNRVSRTYAPKASRMALYQADLVRTQAAYNAAMAAGGAGAARYAEAIKKLKREIIGLKYEQSRLRGGFGLRSGAINSALTPMLGMAAAGGAAGLGYGAVSMANQIMQQQSIKAQFQGLYGTEAAGQAGFNQYMQFANLRGIRGMQNAQDYLSFMYAGSSKIGTEGTNKIFQSFTELAKVRGTSGERYTRALTALGQMLS